MDRPAPRAGGAARRRIAIIGAGGAGTRAALELAGRGHEVDLFERREEAVSQASFVNEGKIHLGLIYAKDPGMRSAARMVDGVLCFERNLERWIPFRAGTTPWPACWSQRACTRTRSR